MNQILRIALLLVVFLMAISLLVLMQKVSPEQTKPTSSIYTFPDTLEDQNFSLDSIKRIIGENKVLPEGFELAAAIACSAYPELRDVHVEMLLTKDGVPMESSFDIWSMFGSKANRHYRILLNDSEDSFFDPILLRSLPFDAQVGILAHELGHIVYYDQLNLLQIAKWGLLYLTDQDFRSTHEKSTDLMPVYHGLGSQIYQYAWYVRKSPACESFYKKEKWFMDKYYLTDNEIKAAWTGVAIP